METQIVHKSGTGPGPDDELPLSIASLDLERIAWKLQKEDPERFTDDVVELGVREYKRMLTLKLENPDAGIVPTEFVDEFWHQHILDTRAYAEDCQRIFGHFVHHYPYFGMHGEDDQAELERAFAETARLYEQHFGEPMPEPVEARCAGHPCHAPSDCACRAPGTCK